MRSQNNIANAEGGAMNDRVSSGVVREKGLFPKIEEEVLQYWRDNDIFRESLKQPLLSEGGQKKEYVLYDGPPFANGLPHYGHLLTGFAKDLFGRYHTMLGQKCERRFGWDCHGLPAEMEAEKELGITGRLAIQQYSVKKFNEHCAQSVLRYTREWKEYVTRQGRWVDFEGGYRTMDISYMESVLWAFKTLYDKGLLYEDYRVMPYSWACETPLSNFETQLDNSYRSIGSKSVYTKFLIKNPNDALVKNWPNVDQFFAVAWTTTPWTLPANLALAVNADIEYTVIEKEEGGQVNGYIVAGGLAESLRKIIG